MNEPTRFGPYLLLKKLSEDALGEAYRAARIEGDVLGDFFFLRILNGSGVDSNAMVAAMKKYEPAAQRLSGPGLTHVSESGDVSGVPFAAYSYVTAWDLKGVLAVANAGFSDLERDYALLLGERIAKGLTVVHQTEAIVARPNHGLLVPQNIMVTSEGEVRIVGFESAAYIAGLAAKDRLDRDTQVYLSPEVRAGAAPTAVDDVYSLGTLLWELLMGSPPPLDVSAQLTSHLSTATLVDGGEPLPAGLAELLQLSLAPARVRTKEAVAWHKQLTDWMARREVKTTHFDLAFSIHELFRQQIQAEQAEVENEKAIDLSQPAGAPAPVVLATPQETGVVYDAPREATGTGVVYATPGEGTGTGIVYPAQESGMGRWGVGAAAALVVLALGAVGFLVMIGREPEVTVTPPPALPPVVEAPVDELQIAELELERLVQATLTASDDDMAEQIRLLEEQLAEAKAANEAEAARIAAAPAPPPPRTSQPAPPQAPPPEATPPPPEPTPAPTPKPATEPTQAAPPEAVPPPPPPPEPTPAPVAAPPPARPAPPPQQAAPAKPPVVTTPVRRRMQNPVYPARARQMRKTAVVLIKVLVDPRGRVLDAKPVVEKDDPFGFAQSAVRAARTATFDPGRRDGVPIEMWTTVVISFKL